MLGIALLNVALIGLFFKELFFLTFDEELARASGLRVRLYDYALLTLLALTIVVATRVVGVILVEALLVIPAATGLQLSADYRRVIAIGAATGVGAAVGGLFLSYELNIASGATIVLVAVAFLALAAALATIRRRLAVRRGLAKQVV
jgi:zinc transport system permease protein